ncbi:uncharacterized, partial [Tachysurus ichikawai]
SVVSGCGRVVARVYMIKKRPASEREGAERQEGETRQDTLLSGGRSDGVRRRDLYRTRSSGGVPVNHGLRGVKGVYHN